MKEVKDCKIVQDLLPSYIDGLTNEDTNQYIEEHLKECEECKKKLENFPLPHGRYFVFYLVKYPKHLTISGMYFVVLDIYLLNDIYPQTSTQTVAVKG